MTFSWLEGGLVGIHALLWCTLLGNLWYLRRHRTRSPVSDAPSISVLIPARNEARNLRRLIPSLLSQTYPKVEIIVYDDGSEDGTWAVLESFEDERLRPMRGDGPPPGWVGKVHALYQTTQAATGDHYLFLDADAELRGPDALQRIVERYASLPPKSILTGLPRLAGGAALLVSLVPNAILTGLPWPLVRPIRSNALGALNGQCWMVDAETYHAFEPHETLPNEVLEDVEIGRYLKRQGYTPVLVDLQEELSIYMYESFDAAWKGFRKNAYLLLGGSPFSFAILFVLFATTFVLSPLVALPLIGSVYGLKALTDWRNGFPLWVSVLAPVSYLLASILQADSAWHHLRGRVSWKGRRVGA